MKLNSLRSRIIVFMASTIILAISGVTIFFSINTKRELSNALKDNAYNLLNATKNQVESYYNSIIYYKKSMINRRKIELKNNTDIAYSTVKFIYNNYKKFGLSEKEAKKRAMLLLEKMRWNNGVGYFWINDTTKPIPKIIMHPVRPSLIGKSSTGPRYNCMIDENGNKKKGNIFAEFLRIALTENEGYVNYLWPKPTPTGLTKDQPKIGFVKYFKPWQWVIGTGVYVDDIERDVQKRINAVIDDLNQLIKKQKIGKNGYFFVFNDKNKVLAHPIYRNLDGNKLINPSTGNNIFDDLKNAYHNGNKSLEYLWNKSDDKEHFIYRKKAYITYFKPLKWYVASTIYVDDYLDKINTLNLRIFIFSAIFILASLFISILLSKSISKPLNELIDSISKTDEDGIPVENLDLKGPQEIKVLSNTINKMLDSIKNSRKELKESEAFNKLLFKDSMIPLVVMDANTYEYIDCNQAAADIYKFNTIENTIGKTPYDVSAKKQYNNIDSKILAKEYIKKAQKEGSIIFEWKHQRENGEIWDAEVQLMAFKYNNKDLLQFSLLDITERKKAQAELNHKRKMDAIGQLAGGIAHDFNNMLSAIINSAEMLKKSIKNNKESNLINIILKSSLQASELTKKLLAFGRKDSIDSNLLNCHDIINDVVSILEKTIDRRIKISKEFKAEQFYIKGNETSLINALMNLGINAANAMPKGGKLIFKTSNIYFNKEYCEKSHFDIIEGNYIKITIEDTGVGISPENIDKIFEPFFTTKKQGEGLGLGLPAVYGTVQDHKGVIEVHSKLNEGTAFHIYLLIQSKFTAQRNIHDKESSNFDKITILLIDDEDVVGQSTQFILEELGHEVILATSGNEGLEIYKNDYENIDVVITDMIMPDISGADLFYKLKTINPNCKVILYSGYTSDQNVEELRKNGLSAFLQKPFKFDKLISVLSKVMYKN